MISSALAIATEYYAALVVVPEALWLIYRVREQHVPLATNGNQFPVPNSRAVWGALVPLSNTCNTAALLLAY